MVGLQYDDLITTIEGLQITGGQRSWLRRCLDTANAECAFCMLGIFWLVHYLLTCDRFVGALAAKGDSAPAQNDGGAIRALVDTIKNEEV